MYMPLMIDIKRALVFGGERGEGLQKAEKLAFFAQEMLVVPEGKNAPEIMVFGPGPGRYVKEKLVFDESVVVPVFPNTADQADLRALIQEASFVTSDLEDRKLNRRIAQICGQLGRPCNIIDDKELCNTWFMSTIHTPTMILGISSQGGCAFYSKQTRLELQEQIEDRSEISRILTWVRAGLPRESRLQGLEELYSLEEFQRLAGARDWKELEVFAQSWLTGQASESG
jgi:siroheme synthase (precorrin-2 oxidase/ferrochelatase)